MPSLFVRAKRAAEFVPEPLARLDVYVPFSWRLGSEYARNVRGIARLRDTWPSSRVGLQSPITSMLSRDAACVRR